MLRLFRSALVIPAASVLVIIVALLVKPENLADASRPIVVYAHPPCPPQLMKIYEDVFDDFREEHPEIDFRVERVTSMYEQNILTRIAGGVAPDIIFVYPQNFALWVSKGAIIKLNDLIEQDPDFDIGDYYENIVDIFSVGDGIYGIPKDGTSFYLTYNKDIFDRAGIPYPDETWDWDKFLEVSKKLTKDVDGDGKVDQFGSGAPSWEELVWQNGGRVFSDDAKRCLLDSPDAIEALEFYADLQIKYHVSPNPIERSFLGDITRFWQGEMAMMRSAYPHSAELRNRCEFEWDIALLPKGKAGRASRALPSAYAISTQSRHPKEAFEFMKFLTGREGMMKLIMVENAAFKPVATSEEFLHGDFLPKHKDVVSETVKYARAFPQTPYFQEAMDRISQQLTGANGGLGPITDPRSPAAPGELAPKIIPDIDKILQQE